LSATKSGKNPQQQDLDDVSRLAGHFTGGKMYKGECLE
jgi:hypothetical protein